MREDNILSFAEPDVAQRVVDPERLEQKMRETVLAPAEFISGWTVWACPDARKCPNARFRLRVSDGRGVSSWKEFDDERLSGNLLTIALQLGPIVSMKGVPRRRVSKFPEATTKDLRIKQ
jgi:hypothetical protein